MKRIKAWSDGGDSRGCSYSAHTRHLTTHQQRPMRYWLPFRKLTMGERIRRAVGPRILSHNRDPPGKAHRLEVLMKRRIGGDWKKLAIYQLFKRQLGARWRLEKATSLSEVSIHARLDSEARGCWTTQNVGEGATGNQAINKRESRKMSLLTSSSPGWRHELWYDFFKKTS